MKILLAVSGGIATYKAIDLLRTLQRAGIDVQVAMTQSATQFVAPLTFATLSGHQVLTSLWSPEQPAEAAGYPGPFAIEHMELAQQIDALVVAPATANLLANFAHGATPDLISTVYLATRAPVLVAPAMNSQMWSHPATIANLRTLRERGNLILPPDFGTLACGMVGEGKLAQVPVIAQAVTDLLARRTQLAGETILVTAGGTREPIDPVRYLGNRSSGKMGHALAAEALAQGANVILVTAAPLPALPCEIIPVETAAEMRTAVLAHLPRATVVIKAAAVSDFQLAGPAPQKLKRQGDLTLTLTPTPDIAAEVAAHRSPGTLLVVFAAETSDLLPRARAKLLAKGADAVFANDVSLPGSGFDADQNAGILLTATSEAHLPMAPKSHIAKQILDLIPTLREHSHRRSKT